MLKPVIDPIATLGSTLLLVDIAPKFEQVKNDDGKFERTDKIISYVYSVVCVERKFEKVSIKIDEKRPLFDTEKEDIPESTIVAFENLTITPYVQNGWIQLSSKADKCFVCEEE
ncbi:hypothetical protein P9B03_11195 [Metasolibacillus meyeri]|uniref:Uncharacterized protein n=1 Tax=Metasolibacillus meyeri TaxID=1071052 RepID=A0AAW9NUP7_9BACL|nr:hypothetical protein [Metasolibacillus meyeri]MEC1179049.1 hypothetical protein [Metasolibacillus meyeri]